MQQQVQKKTLKYTTRLSISFFLCFLVMQVQAQNKIIEEKKDSVIPFYNGVVVQFDLGSVVNTLTSKGNYYTYEASVQVGLKKKFYPIAEVGYAGSDKVSYADIGFKTNAPFLRIGTDINLLSQKPGSKPHNNLFLAGFRVGMSKFNYQLSDVKISDDYWGGTQNFLTDEQTTTKYWWELVAGVRVQVTGNIYIGWTGRKKFLITSNKEGMINPWYIPGFGINSGSSWGFTYTIGYKF